MVTCCEIALYVEFVMKSYEFNYQVNETYYKGKKKKKS